MPRYTQIVMSVIYISCVVAMYLAQWLRLSAI
jgi:hypothetical protein